MDGSIKHPHTSMNIFTKDTNLSQRKCKKVRHIFSLFRHSWDILPLYLFGFLWVLSSLLLQSKDFQFKCIGHYKWPILQVLYKYMYEYFVRYLIVFVDGVSVWFYCGRKLWKGAGQRPLLYSMNKILNFRCSF